MQIPAIWQGGRVCVFLSHFLSLSLRYNDNSTWCGADYVYDQDALMKAIGDWGGEGVDKGRKVMIVVG